MIKTINRVNFGTCKMLDSVKEKHTLWIANEKVISTIGGLLFSDFVDRRRSSRPPTRYKPFLLLRFHWFRPRSRQSTRRRLHQWPTVAESHSPQNCRNGGNGHSPLRHLSSAESLARLCLQDFVSVSFFHCSSFLVTFFSSSSLTPGNGWYFAFLVLNSEVSNRALKGKRDSFLTPFSAGNGDAEYIGGGGVLAGQYK